MSQSTRQFLLSWFIGIIILSSSTAVRGFSPTSTRRDVIEQIQKITPFVATTLLPNIAIAETDSSTPISASWNAVDGLNSLDSKFVSFNKSAYKAMMDDKSRTPLFEQAIINRLKSAEGGPESQVVLDLGTGPFALFAVIAAKNGMHHIICNNLYVSNIDMHND